MSRSGTVSARLCAAVMALGATLCAVGAAHADPGDPGKKVVILGDSYTAHGDAITAILTGQNDGCYHGATAWPSQLRTLMGLDGTDQVSDHSCPGAMIDSDSHYSLLTEAREADADHGFGPGTELVAIQLGLNDDWGVPGGVGNAFRQCGFDLIQGCDNRNLDFGQVNGDVYAAKISKVTAFIKYYAPNAHIVLVGYPGLGPTGSGILCVNTLGFPVVQTHARPMLHYFELIDQAQRDAAQQLGLDFFDTRTLTAAHDMCSPDPWVNGIFDPRTEFTGRPFHPDADGDRVVAAGLYDTFLHGQA